MNKKYVLIAKDIKLTYRLTAKEILISNEGDIVILTDRIPSKSPVLSAEYLNVLCKNYYYSTENRQLGITDIMARELPFGYIRDILTLIEMKNDRIMYITSNHE